jgi:hypothetical protein
LSACQNFTSTSIPPEDINELFSWEEWFCASLEQIHNDEDYLPYFTTWIQIALDNDDLKTHEETPATHEETSKTREVTGD